MGLESRPCVDDECVYNSIFFKSQNIQIFPGVHKIAVVNNTNRNMHIQDMQKSKTTNNRYIYNVQHLKRKEIQIIPFVIQFFSTI